MTITQTMTAKKAYRAMCAEMSKSVDEINVSHLAFLMERVHAYRLQGFEVPEFEAAALAYRRITGRGYVLCQ
jgi:hypothetical protein